MGMGHWVIGNWCLLFLPPAPCSLLPAPLLFPSPHAQLRNHPLQCQQ